MFPSGEIERGEGSPGIRIEHWHCTHYQMKWKEQWDSPPMWQKEIQQDVTTTQMQTYHSHSRSCEVVLLTSCHDSSVPQWSDREKARQSFELSTDIACVIGWNEKNSGTHPLSWEKENTVKCDNHTHAHTTVIQGLVKESYSLPVMFQVFPSGEIERRQGSH